MTGYGIAKGNEEGYSITAELRTLNSKFLDTNVKLPRAVLNKELEVRNTLSAGLVRGKASLSVELKKETGTSEKIGVNKTLFKTYFEEFKAMAEEVGAGQDDLFRLALHSPDVMNSDNEEDEDELVWSLIKKYLGMCIDHCNEFRTAEGKTLEKELSLYVQNIKEHLNHIKEMDGERMLAIRERVQGHIKEISESDDFDKNRYEQEMIYYIEKLDISEEILRLGTHLDYFLETMGLADSQGKKLGFISQEIGREINTIGSKANYAEMQKHVVCMKDELEKMKEQLLNVL